MKNVLGPFLCRPGKKSMGFWLAFGPGAKAQNIEIVIFDLTQNTLCTRFPLKSIVDSQYGAYIGTTDNLKPDIKYRYEVILNGKKYCPLDLVDDDLTFQTLPEDGDFDFFLASCHGVEQYEKDHKNTQHTFRMWSYLNEDLNKNSLVKIGILGGDQVYMDDKFETSKNLKKF